MHINKFIQKNGLNIHKYSLQGYCEYKNENISILLFILRNISNNNKTGIQIVIKDDNCIDYNLLNINKSIPDITYNNNKIKFQSYFKIVGYLQSQFKLTQTPNQTLLISDFFNINELKSEEISKLTIHETNRYIKVSSNEFYNNLDQKIWVPNKIIVHDGKMHADDIFTAALARYINPNIKIIRTRDIPDDFDGLIADVGNTRYDHHETRELRVNKITGETYTDAFGNIKAYAAFGLLARDILPGIIGEKSYYTIDHQFISALDNSDNYGTFNDVSYLFELFNPAWNSTESSDEKFEEAVNIATIFLKQMIERELARTEAIPYVKNSIRQMKDNILILDKRAPWQGLAKKSEALLAIYPVDTGFAVQTVQVDSNDGRINKSKILLPKYWLTDEITGLLFCHKELFFAIFDTKEHAIENAKLFINSLEEVL